MVTSINKFYFLVLGVHSALTVAAITPYPLGINFGPTYITAAQINASTGEPILVASVKGSDAYIAFVENSLQNEGMKYLWMGQWYLRDGNSSIPIPRDPSSTPEGETIFAASLMAINKEATKTLGESVDITSISIPEHFNETLYGSVSNAGMKNEQGFIQPWQVRRFPHAARLAYGLNSCEGFGLGPDLCDIDDGPHYVIFVEYNREYLELFIAEVGDFTFNMVGSTRLKSLGAKVLESESYVSQILGHPPYSKDTGIIFNTSIQSPGRYQNEYQNVIQDFIAKHFPKSDTYDYFQDLRAIMLGGEAPRELFANIRDAVEAALPEHKGKIRDTIDPHFVGAVGAAQWAKRQVLQPEILKEIQGFMHDEL
ncbi:hypothetical protein FQN50_004555 [Emmonsiellopsis sp. PD_5]|nr:hypothetical protein FQN50_004555 [Emmonsiellopsis sp. PD_5]